MLQWFQSRSKRSQAGTALLALFLSCGLCSEIFSLGDKPKEPPAEGAVETSVPADAPGATAESRPSQTAVPAATEAPTDPPTEEPTAAPTALPPTLVPPTAEPPTEAPAPVEPTLAPPPAAAGCININTAPFEDLRRIDQIDEDYANQIIQIRQGRRFRSVDDLVWVNGIGSGRLKKIKAQGLACVG